METRSKIDTVIQDILAQNQRSVKALQPSDIFTKDLGFTSLDVAQLIATLEMELGVDPFSQGQVSIAEVHTVGRLYEVYEDSLAAAAT